MRNWKNLPSLSMIDVLMVERGLVGFRQERDIEQYEAVYNIELL